jgi:hypothetical protein
LREENPPQSSFSKGGRKRKRASPVFVRLTDYAVVFLPTKEAHKFACVRTSLVFLDITSISAVSQQYPVRNAE